jgi:hypothetical protein
MEVIVGLVRFFVALCLCGSLVGSLSLLLQTASLWQDTSLWCLSLCHLAARWGLCLPLWIVWQGMQGRGFCLTMDVRVGMNANGVGMNVNGMGSG